MKRTWNLALVLQIVQKIPENYYPCLYLSIGHNWPSLMTQWVVVQKIYSKMHLVSCTNGWFWWKNPMQGYGNKNFPTFKFVIISFCTQKPNPLGLGNCSVPNCCKTGFRYFCSLFTGTLDKFVPYATGLFTPKKSKLFTREVWFRVFLKLQVENHNKNYNIQYFSCYR